MNRLTSSILALTRNDDVGQTGAADAGQRGDADGFWYKDRKGVMICPGCGSLNHEGGASCHKCARALDAKDSVDMPLIQKGADEGEPSGEPTELFLCPDCGALEAEEAA